MSKIAFYLHGHLQDHFGKDPCVLEVASPGEGIRALCLMVPGFQAYLEEHSAPGYRIVCRDQDIPEGELHFPVGTTEVHIVPAVMGAGSDGFKVVLGAVLVVVSFTPWVGSAGPFIRKIGISLMMAGVSEWLFSAPNPSIYAEKANKKSYLFSGPVNTSAQGVPVPVGYGELRVGGVLISGEIKTDTYLATDMGNDGTTNGTWSLVSGGSSTGGPWVASVHQETSGA